jgi:hypothetical protein
VAAVEAGAGVAIGSHFPLQVPTTFSQTPQDLRGLQTATLLPGTTYANLWQVEGYATIGQVSASLTGFKLSDILNIRDKCVILAMTLNLKTIVNGNYPICGTMPAAGGTNSGFYIYVSNVNLTASVRTGTPAQTIMDTPVPPVNEDFTLILVFDGPNRGFYAWKKGIPIVGISSGAWTGDAHNNETVPLSLGQTFGTDLAHTIGVKHLCPVVLDSLPLNVPQIATAYNGNPAAGIVGARF